MHKQILLITFLSILLSIIYYFVARNIVFAAITGLILLFGFSAAFYLYSNGKKVAKVKKECIYFINQFSVSLSINKTIETTYENVSKNFSSDLTNYLNLFSECDVYEKLEKLKRYFQMKQYDVFLNLIFEYENFGGNILELTHILLHEINKIDINIEEQSKTFKRNLVNFSILWGLNFLILVVMKMSLSNYFEIIHNLSVFPILVMCLFAIFVIHLLILFTKIFDNKNLKKGEKHEKTKKKKRAN